MFSQRWEEGEGEGVELEDEVVGLGG